MARIKITSSNEVNELHVDCCGKSALIPIDGQFHDVADELLPALDDSNATYEIENAGADCEAAAAGGAAGLGGSAAPPKRKAKAKKSPKK